MFVLPSSHLDGLKPTPGWVKLLELPLRENAFFHGDDENPLSLEAAAREDISVPGGAFRNCFRIRIHAAEPPIMDFRLAPNKRVVRWQRRLSRNRFETARLSAE